MCLLNLREEFKFMFNFLFRKNTTSTNEVQIIGGDDMAQIAGKVYIL